MNEATEAQNLLEGKVDSLQLTLQANKAKVDVNRFKNALDMADDTKIEQIKKTWGQMQSWIKEKGPNFGDADTKLSDQVFKVGMNYKNTLELWKKTYDGLWGVNFAVSESPAESSMIGMMPWLFLIGVRDRLVDDELEGDTKNSVDGKPGRVSTDIQNFL